MKRAVRTSDLLVVVTLALAGVGLGHVAEYILLAPHQHERHELLARTGHHYLPAALNLVAFVALLGLVLVFLLGLARGLGKLGHLRKMPAWSRALPAAQALTFAGMEIGERLVAHASLADLGLVLAVGLPLQVLVGYLAGRLVAQVDEAGVRMGQRLRAAPTHPRRSSTTWRPNASSRPTPAPAGVALPARGPPPLLVLA